MDDDRELTAPLWVRNSISYSELYLTHHCVTWTLIQIGHQGRLILRSARIA
jgi:hypothetical protein